MSTGKSKREIDREIETAIYGPWCKECGKVRTRNPSKTCGTCLGPRRCSKCRGSGEITSPRRFPTGCGQCSGTGKIG